MLDTGRIGAGVQRGSNFRPLLVVVAALKLTITSKLTSGFPRQFCVMKLNYTVLDLVPLAGAGREVARRPPAAQFRRRTSAIPFSKNRTREAVAAAYSRR